MAKQNWARVEREALSDLLLETGPDAPTLCAGWTTADLVAHLIVREHRPDTMPGAVSPLLAGYTDRVRRAVRESAPYAELVERFRQGPPGWSPLALSPVDAAANSLEYFVHHEDVRRSRAGWRPRVLPSAFEELLWRRLRAGRLILRRLPVEVTFVDPAGRAQRIVKGGRHARVHGRPSELALWMFGRRDVAHVRMTGEAQAVEMLNQDRRRT